jgi:hypothetical protein
MISAEEAAAKLCPADGGKALLLAGRVAAKGMIADILEELRAEAEGRKPAPKPRWIEYRVGANGKVIETIQW